MASTQVTTSTQTGGNTITHGRNIVLAGSRLYAITANGTSLVYEYSDDDGVSWTGETTIATESQGAATAVYDATNGRLNIVYAGGNDLSEALTMRAITSNVASGTPGALTTATVIDAGGSNAGVQYPYMVHSDTASNDRYWIIAKKTTAASTYETRVWFANAGSDADTAGNWATTNFTNLGSNSDSNAGKGGVGAWWTIGGNDRLTFVFEDGSSPAFYEAVTFDPSAASPTPGTVTSNIATQTSAGGFDRNVNGYAIAAAAQDDYFVFGRLDQSDNTWDFYKTTDGTTWTTPTGWTGLVMGRAAIAKSGDNFLILHTSSYGVMASSAQPLKYRLLTVSSDNMGGVNDFSDTDGNGVAVPEDTGTTKLYGLYRGSTASPYTVRSDSVNIGGDADTTPPGQATVTATCVGDTQNDVAITMPADVDVEEYEVRYLTGSTYPASDRSDGTVAVSPTATTANASVTFEHTGLTSGTRYAYRVFIKDTAGNWNTGATATAVAATRPTFVARYTSGGTLIPDGTSAGGNNVILEYQLAADNFETDGANAFFVLRIGSDSATPPEVSTFDLVSNNAGQTIFRIESPADSGQFASIPAGGLTSGLWDSLLRIYTDTTQSSQYGSLQVRQ